MLITDVKTIEEYYQGLLARNADFLGVYFVGVKTTRIFCLPTCRARKPLLKNVAFYTTIEETELAGFRACKVCRPKDDKNRVPEYVTTALALLESTSEGRVTDALLQQHKISPTSVRRWFRQQHGMTFHAYQRQRRMNVAEENLLAGKTVTDVAYSSGYESLSGFTTAYKRATGKSPSE